MPAYQTVVVGVHDSPTGARAVEMAALMAAETDARLILVSAYRHWGAGRKGGSGYQVRGSVSAERTLERAVAQCAEMGVHDVATSAAPGNPATVLNAAVREHAADLLLVGSHGLATLGGRLLGSVPGTVTATASCDVLVVHTTTDRWQKLVSRRYRQRPSRYVRTILAGVHDSERSMRAVEKAGRIAADGGAKLVLVGTYEPARKKEMALASDALKGESFLAQGSFAIETVLRAGEARARAQGAQTVESVMAEGDALHGLLTVADLRRADLLVLGNNHLPEGGVRLIGTISEQVTRNIPTHVLLVN
jgi:nucleotide-binding universal stress UspA family protein